MCAQAVALPLWHFCPCAFEKVERIIHRQGHMLSSRSPLLHPQKACCHAHSCQLVPVCLSVSITAGSSPSANTAVLFSVLDVDTCSDHPKIWVNSFFFFCQGGKKIKCMCTDKQLQPHYVLIFVCSAILFSAVISAAPQTRAHAPVSIVLSLTSDFESSYSCQRSLIFFFSFSFLFRISPTYMNKSSDKHGHRKLTFCMKNGMEGRKSV